MKGIILAGGTGSRLWPITRVTSKQLLPVYDKPMIYYPLSTLMLAGIRDVLIITTPQDQERFRDLLGDGSQFGIHLIYATQPKPNGLAEALIIAEDFLEQHSCLMILGDNIFHGVGLGHELSYKLKHKSGCHIFTYSVSVPEQYGILEVDPTNAPISIAEKPILPKSNLAITGLYYFDNRGPSFAKNVKPSYRGELEITSVIEEYLKTGELDHTHLSRGTTWLDTGTFENLHEASTYVKIIEDRTGLKIGCPEEIAYNNNWIDKSDLKSISSKMNNSKYALYLESLVKET